MTSCVFCNRIQVVEPAIIVYQDELVSVFPTQTPINEGHLLIIPNRHVEELFSLHEAEYQHMFTIAHRIEKALKKLYGAPRTGLVASGFEIAHAHLHILPIYHHGEIGKTTVEKIDDDEKIRVTNKIRQVLEMK